MCNHEFDVSEDWHAKCRLCGFKIPCDDCAWGSACILINDCAKAANERENGYEVKPVEDER